ncbi:MAG: PAS domain S-box protein [Desulfobulbaceae bacterium]|jgi:PAS domain S-box-containing protein|nr:PAS domain S-box protein [Desulfobulbaceae bacterium]
MGREEIITKSSEFAESVINTVREPVIVLDQDLRVVTVSRSFYDFFKLKPEETVGQLIYDLGNKQWDIPKLRELLEEILPEQTSFDNYEVEHDFATIGRRTMLLNGRQIERGMGKERIILLAIEDITERKRLEDLLTESEVRYRRIFETASNGIVLLEKDEGRIMHGNEAIKKMLGYSEEEYIGKKLQDIGVPLDMSDFPAIMQDLDKKVILNYEDITVKTKSGPDVTTEIYISTDIYMVDRMQLVQCNIRDVSARKKVQQQLRLDHEIISNISDGVYLVRSSDGVIVFANRPFEKMFGYDPGEIIGQHVSVVNAPNGKAPQDTAQAIMKKLRKHGIWRGEVLNIRKDGGTFWCDESVTSLKLERADYGTVWVSVHRDITERKQAEELLTESQQMLRIVLNAIPVRVFWKDRELNYLGCNKQFALDAGFESPAALIGKDDFQMGWREQAELYRADDDNVIKSDIPQLNYEEPQTTPAGGRIWLRTSKIPLKNINDEIIGVLGAYEDITGHKKLEAQLLQSQKMEAVGTLTGGIAHDFNNILNVILGYGTMVMNTLAAGSPAKENMDEVLLAADKAANLTKKLLVFSRKQAVEVKPVNVNELILDLQKMLGRIIRESIEFNLDLADRPLIVLADGGQIEQVLINLAANARDAMPEGGRLTIGTELVEIDEEYVAAYGYGKTGRYALLTVTDTGQGMDAETQKKIFEPFFTTKGVGEGTGLGLAISYGIIKQHSGYLKVYSEPGEGTALKIYLPLSEEEALLETKTEGVAPVKGGNETVLVAEDNAALRNLSRIVLESFGYTVIAAEDGEEAITRFMENREGIGLVLLDMIMPKKNGEEVSEAIRKVCPGMGIVFMSGYTLDIVTNKDLLEAGFDFIQKPFQSKDLLAKVREVLDR